MGSGTYFLWLHWLGCSRLPGQCDAVMCQRVAKCLKCQITDSIQTCSLLVVVFMASTLTCVEFDHIMITNSSGKAWGIFCVVQDKIEWVSANVHILLKMNPALYSCKLQVFPTVVQFAVSWSDVVSLFTWINSGEWQLKFLVWKI